MQPDQSAPPLPNFFKIRTMSSKTISEIIKDYQSKKPLLYNASNPYETQPLIMNHLVFTCLRNHALGLLPRFRKVILCFDHFYYNSIKDLREVKTSTKPPAHCIILQVKFLGGMSMNKYQNIGSIGYYDFTDREIVAECIKEYIEDLHRCDLYVIGTCSSGKCEIMSILCEMEMKSVSDLLSYPVKNRGNLIHLFDPSWMLRKLKGEFCTQDISFMCHGKTLLASYNHINTVFNLQSLKSLFSHDFYNASTKTTQAAAKTFSSTVGALLARLYELDKKVNEKFEGTKIVTLLFDQLFDTFNSTTTERENSKQLRRPLTLHSDHWPIWHELIAILKTMKFVEANREVEIQHYIVDSTTNKENQQPKKQKNTKKQDGNSVSTNNNGKKKRKGGNFDKKKNKGNTGKCDNTVKDDIEANENQILLNDPVNYYSDNEYKSIMYEEKQVDNEELLEMIDNILESNAEDGAAEESFDEAQRASMKAKLQKTLCDDQENTSTCDNVIESILQVLKQFTHTKHYKHLKQVKCLLNAIKGSNDEFYARFGATLTYEYLSFKYSDYVLRIAEQAEDTRTFFNAFIKTLTHVLEIMHFFDMTLFQMWLASIAAIKAIFFYLNSHHFDSFDTKVINCDAIHKFVSVIRDHNGLFPMYVVDQNVYGTMHDFRVCVLAFTEDCNQTITSLIITKEDIRKLQGEKTD